MTTPSRAHGPTPRLPGLDTLRAAAILWVMLFHAAVLGLGPRVPEGLALAGWMGVDLFFVLSGYLIGGQWLPQAGSGAPPPGPPVPAWRRLAVFWWRRAWRVLPAFWVVLAVYALLPAWREAPGLESVWKFITWTLNLGLIDYGVSRAFSHAWSLCVEEHFYLLFPLLALAVARVPAGAPRRRAAVALILALVAAGLLLRAQIWGQVLAPLQGQLRGPGNFYQRAVEWIYYPSPCRLDGLLAGVALAACQHGAPAAWARLTARPGWLAVAGLAAVLAASRLFEGEARFGFTASVWGYPALSLALAAVVAAAASGRGWLGATRVPGAGPLALISYSVYLSHKLAYAWAQRQFPAPVGDADPSPWLAPLGAGAALLLGAALWWAVERPGLRWRDRLWPAAAR